MTDRSVSVRLRAQVTDFRAGMASAGRSVDELQHKLADSDAKTKARTQQVSRGMLLIGAAGVAAAGAAITAFARFDKQMSNVKAVSNATAGEMDQLRAAAIEAGKATVFSASESAQAEAELAKAGVSTADILGGALTGSLNLASSGQLELADAATIAAQAMNIFKLNGADVSHIADVLAAGANKSAADVKGLGDALRQGGLVAAQTGLDLEDTVGTLAAFADNALIGSDAGTSLKTMLQRLTPQSKESADAMKAIGFSAYDAQGNFIGLDKVAQGLQMGLGKLSAEQRQATLTTIFGSDAVRAASILYEQGAFGINNYTKAVDDQGAAARMAATQLDNLAGDVEQLKGSLETALIQSGSGANGTLRALTQGATGAVNAFSDLPAPVQGSAVAITGVGGAAIAALGGIGYLIPKVAEGRKGLRDLGTAGQFADRSLGRLGKAGLYGAGILALGETVQFLSDKLTDLEGKGAPSVDALTHSLVEFAKSGKIAGAGLQGIGEDATQLSADLDTLNQFGAGLGLTLNKTSFGTFGRDLDQARDRVDAFDKALAGLVETGHADVAGQILKGLAARGVDVDQLRGKLNDYSDALTNADTQEQLAADGSQDLGGALTDTADATDEANTALEDYITTLDDYAGKVFGVQEAQDSLTDAYQTLRDQIKQAKKDGDDNATSLRGNSEAARNNRDALRGIVDETANVVAKMLEHGASITQVNGYIKDQRARLQEARTELGLGKGAAQEYDSAIRHIPDNIPVHASTEQIDHAIARIKELRRQAGIPISVTVNVLNKQAAAEAEAARASGGPVWPGSSFLVGEHGPELFSPSVRGAIVPAGRTASLLSGTTPVKATPTVGGQRTTVAAGDSALMRDLIVYTQQERVEEVIPRVLDQQMYLMRG